MEKYKLDVVSKTLTISKKFGKAIAEGEGEEYEFYTRLMQEIPGLTVVRKSHRTPTSYTSSSGEKFSCNQFKNLKYENKAFLNPARTYELPTTKLRTFCYWR